MSSSVSIIPQDRVTVQTVASFRVDVNNIILFCSANLGIVLFDTSNNYIDAFPMTLREDDYNNWGGNDGYIGTLIAAKLGFTLTPEVVPEVVTEVVTEVVPEVISDSPDFPDLFPVTNESCY